MNSVAPRLFGALAAGVVLVIVGRVAGSDLVSNLGGILMLPMLAIAGLAMAGVVLLAPAWPMAALADRIPPRLGWAFIPGSAAVLFCWWAFLAALAYH